MLKGISFHRLPCSQFVNRCITLTAFIACSWIGCWSVSGQITTQEKQESSTVLTASHTAPVAMFSQPSTAPWEVFGNQSAYFRVEVRRVVNHPVANLYRPSITATLQSFFSSEPNEVPSLKQFGLSVDEITQFQGGLNMVVNYNLEESGGNHSLTVKQLKAEVTAANPVDWPSVINALDFENLNIDFDFEMLRQAWLNSAKKSRAYLFDIASLEQAVDGESVWNAKSLWKKVDNILWGSPTESKKAVWEAVSGGAVTIVYDIVQKGEAPEPIDSFERAWLEMTNATETTAWGVDLSQDHKICQIRFAAVPSEGVSAGELLERFEALRVAYEKQTSDDDADQAFLEGIEKARATIVPRKESNGTTTKSYLLVEGEYTIDFGELSKSAE